MFLIALWPEIVGKLDAMPYRRAPKSRTQRAPTPEIPREMAGLPARLQECIDDQKTNSTMVAELSGHSVPMITQIVNGRKFEGIRASSVIRIANALGVRPAWLLLGEEPKYAGDLPMIISDDGAETLARAIVRELQSKASRPKVPQNEAGGPDDDKHGK